MARPMWFVNLVKKYFPSRFSLAELTKVPVVGARLEGMMVKSHEEGLESLLATFKSRVEAEVTAAV